MSNLSTLEANSLKGALEALLLVSSDPVSAPALAGALRRELDDAVTVINEDFLRYRLLAHPHVIVGNIPFHITTSILRRLLRAPG